MLIIYTVFPLPSLKRKIQSYVNRISQPLVKATVCWRVVVILHLTAVVIQSYEQQSRYPYLTGHQSKL
ncbi:hypothetical protein J6590_086070, partial [Homalodisca vitripennis]